MNKKILIAALAALSFSGASLVAGTCSSYTSLYVDSGNSGFDSDTETDTINKSSASVSIATYAKGESGSKGTAVSSVGYALYKTSGSIKEYVSTSSQVDMDQTGPTDYNTLSVSWPSSLVSGFGVNTMNKSVEAGTIVTINVSGEYDTSGYGYADSDVIW
ncbi:hypothetical protein MLD52_05840 [Puniceicoccaceae bacterium K14]|nr:hypothetical protein [Puniceicoccaceae bacterium K14]